MNARVPPRTPDERGGAALIFVFRSSPTWVVALVIAIVLLIVLGLIQLIGTPPATPQAKAAG